MNLAFGAYDLVARGKVGGGVVPLDIKEIVRLRLHEFLSGTTPDPLGLREVVAKFGALPLVMDMGGASALREDGQIITYAWDEPHDAQIQLDELERNRALYRGSLTYPELAELLPARPDDGLTCHFCRGSGVAVGLEGIPNVACYCGGLGWVPARYGPATAPN